MGKNPAELDMMSMQSLYI